MECKMKSIYIFFIVVISACAETKNNSHVYNERPQSISDYDEYISRCLAQTDAVMRVAGLFDLYLNQWQLRQVSL